MNVIAFIFEHAFLKQPNFLHIGSRPSNTNILPDEGKLMIGKAKSFVENLLQSVQTGKVTVGTLNVLQQNEIQLLRLAEIIQANEENNANGEMQASGQPSFKESYHHRLDELEQFNQQKEKVQHFVRCCDRFPLGKSLVS